MNHEEALVSTKSDGLFYLWFKDKPKTKFLFRSSIRWTTCINFALSEDGDKLFAQVNDYETAYLSLREKDQQEAMIEPFNEGNYSFGEIFHIRNIYEETFFVGCHFKVYVTKKNKIIREVFQNSNVNKLIDK